MRLAHRLPQLIEQHLEGRGKRVAPQDDHIIMIGRAERAKFAQRGAKAPFHAIALDRVAALAGGGEAEAGRLGLRFACGAAARLQGEGRRVRATPFCGGLKIRAAHKPAHAAGQLVHADAPGGRVKA